MDETTRVHFEKLEQAIRENFDDVQITRSSSTEQRTLLDVYCTFKGYRVRNLIHTHAESNHNLQLTQNPNRILEDKRNGREENYRSICSRLIQR